MLPVFQQDIKIAKCCQVNSVFKTPDYLNSLKLTYKSIIKIPKQKTFETWSVEEEFRSLTA